MCNTTTTTNNNYHYRYYMGLRHAFSPCATIQCREGATEACNVFRIIASTSKHISERACTIYAFLFMIGVYSMLKVCPALVPLSYHTT